MRWASLLAVLVLTSEAQAEPRAPRAAAARAELSLEEVEQKAYNLVSTHPPAEARALWQHYTATLSGTPVRWPGRVVSAPTEEVLRLQRPMLLTRQPAHALAPLEVRVPGLVALQRSQLPAGALAEVRGVIAEVTMQEGVVVTLRSTGLLLLDADGAPVTAEGKLLIRLSRSTCFGRCPAYEVAVDRAGTVKWDGQSAVRATGARTRRIPRAQVRALLAEIESAGFFAMADQYPRQATDHPTYTLEVVDGARAKTVSLNSSNRDAPAALHRLLQRVDKLLGTAPWIGAPAR